jgi:hypothetical protein
MSGNRNNGKTHRTGAQADPDPAHGMGARSGIVTPETSVGDRKYIGFNSLDAADPAARGDYCPAKTTVTIIACT